MRTYRCNFLPVSEAGMGEWGPAVRLPRAKTPGRITINLKNMR